MLDLNFSGFARFLNISGSGLSACTKLTSYKYKLDESKPLTIPSFGRTYIKIEPKLFGLLELAKEIFITII
jgi:hypothetical protein